MFDASAQNAHETAKALLELVEHYENVPDKVKHIKDLEHAGDEITHQILENLAKTFITPLDREDIQRITKCLDDITDLMDSAANRMMIYKTRKATEESRAFGRLLVTSTAVLVEVFERLRNIKKPEAIVKLLVQVHTHENEGDRLMQQSLADLFENEPDAKEILKWKDIYQILEKATDRCEDVADVLNTILVKHG
jgi:predicted phosphate transport protein (TIGR00153 family)